jgi:hypothetical protein
MQKIYSRTNPAPFEASGHSATKPVIRVDDALCEFAHQDAAQGLKPANTTQVVLDANSLIQQAVASSSSRLWLTNLIMEKMVESALQFDNSTYKCALDGEAVYAPGQRKIRIEAQRPLELGQ